MAKSTASGSGTGTSIPAGCIMPFAGDATKVPAGWLLCDGSTVSRSSFRDLFNIVGTAYGEGDGSSTFHIPDMRGNFIRGVDDPTGSDPANRDPNDHRTALNTGGNATGLGSYQQDAMDEHYHQTYWGGIGGGSAYPEDPYISNNFAGAAHGTSGMLGLNDTLVSTETRPKNIAVNYIIKV